MQYKIKFAALAAIFIVSCSRPMETDKQCEQTPTLPSRIGLHAYLLSQALSRSPSERRSSDCTYSEFGFTNNDTSFQLKTVSIEGTCHLEIRMPYEKDEKKFNNLQISKNTYENMRLKLLMQRIMDAYHAAKIDVETEDYEIRTIDHGRLTCKLFKCTNNIYRKDEMFMKNSGKLTDDELSQQDPRYLEKCEQSLSKFKN